MHHQSHALLEESIAPDVGSRMATPFIINISPCQIHPRQRGFHNLNCQILRIGLGRSYHPWFDTIWIASYSEMGREKYICQLYAVKAQTSLAPLSQFHGSRVTTAHAHQCCIFQLCEDCAVANEIDYAWTCIHDNGHMIMACDVWL